MDLFIRCISLVITSVIRYTQITTVSSPISLLLQWFKNGRKITPDEHTEITCDGCVHTMRIPRSVVEDSAEFTAKIGKAKTAAKLVVEGNVTAS